MMPTRLMWRALSEMAKAESPILKVWLWCSMLPRPTEQAYAIIWPGPFVIRPVVLTLDLRR